MWQEFIKNIQNIFTSTAVIGLCSPEFRYQCVWWEGNVVYAYYMGSCCVHLCSDVGHLTKERRVTAYSLTLAEFTDVTVQDLLKHEACDEVKIHFVRPKGQPHDWSGSVVQYRHRAY